MKSLIFFSRDQRNKLPPSISRDILAMSMAFPQEFLLTRETISGLNLNAKI